ncbi:MAG: Rne/Rng family ribonuclease [candidate division WOR-3 bacterium]|nr:Rne/Rng family ribonuclease [candidate division WOR-3 bacterium]MCX7756748.1 Rne/Rng family ribonuclease [candidate division WOR-3 bacterium]MDW7987362.1 Rne/Rng family ribonuclease [candidate division WOR-3 bacterium]
MPVNKEIIITTRQFEGEIRIAVLENNQLVEFYLEHEIKRSLVGRVYKGIVENVIPGLRGAFVNLGLKKNGFLPLADIPELEIFDESKLELEPDTKKREYSPIVLSKGQEIICQVTKEPIGEKGPRITSYISLAGRYLVYFPNASRIGISRRIQDRKIRSRLRELVKRIKKPDVGLIVRTSAELANEEMIETEYNELENRWREIENKAKIVKAPSLLYEEEDILLKVIRDHFTPDVSLLTIDDRIRYEQIIQYLQKFAPALADRVKLYENEVPIFEYYKITQELYKILDRKVWLKSGGFITIDQTEALVAIDVNSGRYSSEEDPETLIFQTNLSAAAEIARQIRLRDLSGLIIIDFIDMQDPKKMDIVVRELKMCLENDRAKADFAKVSRFGILEMTRERIRPGLLFSITDECPVCKGLGRILMRKDAALKIEKAVCEKLANFAGEKIKIQVSPLIYDYWINNRYEQLSEIAQKYQVTLELKPNSELSYEEYKMFHVSI